MDGLVACGAADAVGLVAQSIPELGPPEGTVATAAVMEALDVLGPYWPGEPRTAEG